MMTLEDFVKRWRHHVGGLALFGHVSEQRDGALVRAGKIMDIPDIVESLLKRLWEDAQPKPPETKPPALNGSAGNHLLATKPAPSTVRK